jgi:conjugal transfer pilus assembly protein TraD
MTGLQARRCLSLALWAALLLAPSLPVAIGLLAAGSAVSAAPAVGRAIRRWRAGRRAPPAGAQLVLGTDARGRPVALGDPQLAAHALIVGASGAGKSTTMLAILDAQIRRGQAVVAIDMKGSPGFAAQLRSSAAAAGRRLQVWTLDGPGHWNPLAHGNATSLKDKLISSERFTEPHYQRAAERYVQTVLGVLQAARPDRAPQLHEVVALMEPLRLSALLRDVPGPRAEQVQDYLAGLIPDQLSAVRGLGTRLALLSESCAGPYLRTGRAEDAVDVRAALEGGDVVLFSLNSSVYGNLAAQLGTLAIQDLVSATGGRLQASASGDAAPPATVAIDEFSALDNDNVLALVARGRESGVRVMLATQEMADLERAGRGFSEQMVGIVGVKIIHRQDVPASAELVAQMAGTESYWEETRQMRGLFAGRAASSGTRRPAERYVVHPNVIKRLEPGQAIVLTKLPTAQVQLIAVRRPAQSHPPPLDQRQPQGSRHRRPPTGSRPPTQRQLPDGRRPPGRDYPAPGVTR